ncbi:MAG: autotransporter domain-containing protein, partial [Selenomonas sp.]|nr:autotransporter domain-containing protein [Selenomonas sp.]
MLADAGFEQAGAAAVAADSAGKFAPFAAMGGSSLRAESGSHVDTKGFGLNVGFAKEVRRGQSTYLFGPVVEYGRGSYDSYQDNGIKADGSSSYWGVGLLGRQTNDDGVYYEGSLRLGKVKADYSGNLVDRTAEYDSSSKYWAGHLGLGRVYKLKGSNSLDGYVKCFFSHQDGDTVTVNLNNGTTDEISFSSTESQRFRIGARLSHQVNPESSVYGGLAYQYETQGESRATYHGFDTAAPSVKGGSVMMELGWKTKPGNSPVSLDLGLTGWAGKQRGISGKMGFNWTF